MVLLHVSLLRTLPITPAVRIDLRPHYGQTKKAHVEHDESPAHEQWEPKVDDMEKHYILYSIFA